MLHIISTSCNCSWYLILQLRDDISLLPLPFSLDINISKYFSKNKKKEREEERENKPVSSPTPISLCAWGPVLFPFDHHFLFPSCNPPTQPLLQFDKKDSFPSCSFLNAALQWLSINLWACFALFLWNTPTPVWAIKGCHQNIKILHQLAEFLHLLLIWIYLLSFLYVTKSCVCLFASLKLYTWCF